MGLLLSAFFWTYGAFQIPAGLAVDRFGIRWSYLCGFLLWSMASAGIALSRNIHDVFFLRLLLGMAESVGPIASLTLIRQKFSERERGLPVAIYIAGQNLGPACGALLGTALLTSIGWRGMFAYTGLGALLWLPFWLRFTRAEKTPAAKRLTNPTSAPKSNQLFSLLSTWSFWAMSLCVFLFSYYWYFVLTWIPTYLNVARDIPMLTMGRILSAALFLMAIVNVAAGRLADRIISRGRNALPVRIGFATAGFIGASTILLLGTVSSHRSLLILLTVSVCFFGVASASFWALAQQIAPASKTARIIAYLNTCSQIGGAAAPIITGYTLGPEKNFSLAIALAGLCAFASGCLLLVTGTHRFENLNLKLS